MSLIFVQSGLSGPSGQMAICLVNGGVQEGNSRCQRIVEHVV